MAYPSHPTSFNTSNSLVVESKISTPLFLICVHFLILPKESTHFRDLEATFYIDCILAVLLLPKFEDHPSSMIPEDFQCQGAPVIFLLAILIRKVLVVPWKLTDGSEDQGDLP